MYRLKTQQSYGFDQLTALQHGWDLSVIQLGPAGRPTMARLHETANVAYVRFRCGAAYDQRLRSRSGLVSFGLLDADNPTTWTYDQVIPNDAVTVFPADAYLRGPSPIGFRGSGMHFKASFLAAVSERVYRRPLAMVVPDPGLYVPDQASLMALRRELRKWQQLVAHAAHTRPAIIERREETLALALLGALDSSTAAVEEQRPRVTARSMALALEFIHESAAENISASAISNHAQCSQRTLEKGFVKRFGVTPKKYIKCLRLARVHCGLLRFTEQDCDSIIELAGRYGFWHMGQLAADYRHIYGELPSETLGRSGR